MKKPTYLDTVPRYDGEARVISLESPSKNYTLIVTRHAFNNYSIELASDVASKPGSATHAGDDSISFQHIRNASALLDLLEVLVRPKRETVTK